MGIQLDWEVEAERSIQQHIGEDPKARRKRRMGTLRLLFILAILACILGGIGFFVKDQIDRINERVETNLRDTVQAEITALRLGDWNAFAMIQRSASEDWLRIQRTQFEHYQTILFESNQTQLTGQILDVTIQDPRARVHVQEIIDGVPYTRVWFYWLYDAELDSEGRETRPGGWYHVPPDYTFWGNSQLYQGQYATVAYRDVDLAFGESVGQVLDNWTSQACEAFNCTNLPRIRVQVAPQDHQEIAWAPGEITDEWVLLIASPYADRARTDMPFSPELRVEIAVHLAERLTSFQMNGQRMISVDSTYLQQSVITWLVGRFVQVDTGAYFVESLAQHYGLPAVGALIRGLSPMATIRYVSDITQLPLDQSGLDWRDFFTWRLHQEQELWERSLLNEYLTLYDTREQSIQQDARLRFERGLNTKELVVSSVGLTSPTDEGYTQVLATVVAPDGATYQVVYRLVENVWLRAN
jgi:hypothetical protein